MVRELNGECHTLCEQVPATWRPRGSVLWRAGWRWAGVDGTSGQASIGNALSSELIGPDDPVDER